jgi:hypothetical protein
MSSSRTHTHTHYSEHNKLVVELEIGTGLEPSCTSSSSGFRLYEAPKSAKV